MNVAQVCQRNVVTIRPSEDLCAAAHLMREKHIGYLVVVEPAAAQGASTPVGVLTDRDIVMAVVSQGLDPKTLTVGDVMTAKPRTVLLEDCIEDALAQMQSIGVRRLPVLGASGYLAGILSLDDVLTTMAEGLGRAARAIHQEQSREKSARP
jgi:CBS domain-containing protein